MDAKDCKVMNEAYEGRPWLVDSGGVSLARRPRLYWFNWDVQLKPQLQDKALFENCWDRCPSKARIYYCRWSGAGAKWQAGAGLEKLNILTSLNSAP